MNEQRLIDLLKHADTADETPEVSSTDLAGRAIQRAARRARLRRIGYGVLAVDAAAALIFVAFLILPGVASKPLTGPAEHTVAEPYEPGDEQLQVQLVMQEAVVEALRDHEARSLAQNIYESDPLNEVHAQTDLAARRMVLAAQRIESDTGPSDFTHGLYANVLAHFPDSPWASIARRRINESQTYTEPRSSL